MTIADRHGLPVPVHVESATPHEVTLVKARAVAVAADWGRAAVRANPDEGSRPSPPGRSR
jgi:hypothetical protein